MRFTLGLIKGFSGAVVVLFFGCGCLLGLVKGDCNLVEWRGLWGAGVVLFFGCGCLVIDSFLAERWG